MSHLSDERLFELGVSERETPTADETAHLTDCTACAGALERERSLTAALGAIELPRAPSDFVAATTRRYESAMHRRHVRATIGVLAMALVAGLLVCVPLLGILVANAGVLVHAAATAIHEIAVVFDAMVVVFDKLPIIPLLLVAAMGGAALASAGMLGRAAAATAPVK